MLSLDVGGVMSGPPHDNSGMNVMGRVGKVGKGGKNNLISIYNIYRYIIIILFPTLPPLIPLFSIFPLLGPFIALPLKRGVGRWDLFGQGASETVKMGETAGIGSESRGGLPGANGGVWVSRSMAWFSSSSGMLADRVTILGTEYRKATHAMIAAMRQSGADETRVDDIAAEFAAMGPSG
jgi:hypothetical protein